jgi:hypothetical protein
MRRVDAFIVADEMQFSSSGWAHRNRVRGPDGAHWLTLPARPAHGQAICEVALDPTVPWTAKHLETLRHFYARSPFAADILDALAAALRAGATRVVDATVPVIRFLATRLGLTTPLLVSSELGLEARYRAQFPHESSPTHRIIAFMQALGARDLLEGASGRSYLDVALCEAHGIRVTFHEYAHPTYPQLHTPFVSHLSVLDLLLCRGDREARQVLEGTP